jgi:SAM-dependent methyltransferase
MLRRSARGVLERTVRLALREPHVRRVVERELRSPRASAVRPAIPGSTAPVGVFVDRRGVSYALDPNLRDRLKPNWRAMCDPDRVGVPPSDDDLAGRARKARSVVDEARALTQAVAGAVPTGRILEIGCYDGAVAFHLSRETANTVVASDLARYYVVQRPGVPNEAAVATQQTMLGELRGRAGRIAGLDPGRVTFVEDDITRSSLPDASFDWIVSFEVLEHVLHPSAALSAMVRLLRPGGVMYHDYNPFFAINGGHSLCTLDFAWGHARLDAEDFDRYVRERRPGEVGPAQRFFSESLNRMTHADLRAAVEAAGLEPLALIPWTDRSVVPKVSVDVIADAQRLYPTATVEDLLATFVAIVARRPGGTPG